MLERIVRNSLCSQCNIQETDRLLLGFSGGPDSVCLLHILVLSGMDVEIAYFDHQLRPESEDEAQFAHETADKYGLQCHIGSADVRLAAADRHESVEAVAREYRYRFLAEKAALVQSAAIVVAHHADDQVETILMNMFRGSGLHGLTGMSFRKANAFSGGLDIVRPMLTIWKDEILAYCRENGLPYQVDQTNLGTDYTRNALRNQIIPSIEAVYPGVKQNIQRMRAILQEDELFLEGHAQHAYARSVQEAEDGLVWLDVNVFQSLPVSVQRRVLLAAIKSAFDLDKDVQFQMVEDARNALMGQTSSQHAQITGDMHVLVEGNSGFIYTDPARLPKGNDLQMEPSLASPVLEVPGKLQINADWMLETEEIGISGLLEMAGENQDPFTAYIDKDALSDLLLVRRRLAGDRFAPLGMGGGSMKISDFWVNNKFPRRFREHYPLVCDGDRIIWIPGYQPAHAVRVTATTRSAIRLRCTRIAD
jgi:tRNA(Ile)-lysidine synthase